MENIVHDFTDKPVLELSDDDKITRHIPTLVAFFTAASGVMRKYNQDHFHPTRTHETHLGEVCIQLDYFILLLFRLNKVTTIIPSSVKNGVDFLVVTLLPLVEEGRIHSTFFISLKEVNIHLDKLIRCFLGMDKEGNHQSITAWMMSLFSLTGEKGG